MKGRRGLPPRGGGPAASSWHFLSVWRQLPFPLSCDAGILSARPAPNPLHTWPPRSASPNCKTSKIKPTEHFFSPPSLSPLCICKTSGSPHALDGNPNASPQVLPPGCSTLPVTPLQYLRPHPWVFCALAACPPRWGPLSSSPKMHPFPCVLAQCLGHDCSPMSGCAWPQEGLGEALHPAAGISFAVATTQATAAALGSLFPGFSYG